MPIVRDYRKYVYLPERVDRCGRDVGKKLYWKLFSIENTFRIVIHSVLSAQFGPNWWSVAVSQSIANKAQAFRRSYTASPRNANPGNHEIYLVFLTDLTEIIRATSHVFRPIVPSIDNWIVALEELRLPRNLVGHMNFPNAFDRTAIDHAYHRLPTLLADLQAFPVPISIP
jgi:hypothetical protein